MKIDIKFDKLDVTVTACLSKDVDQWCALMGDNIQVGISGFGSSILEAIEDFKGNFYDT